jgi:3-dehydroquinate dehydratase-2
VAEVHISNVHKRERFRHHSYISDIAEAVLAGTGIHGYVYAIEALHRVLERREARGARAPASPMARDGR